MRSASGRTTVPMSRPAMTIRRRRPDPAGDPGAPPAIRGPPKLPRPRRRRRARGRRRCDRRHRRALAGAGRPRRARARPRRRGRETVGIRDRNAAREREPGDGAVQQPGVAEAIPDRKRSGCTDAALPRRARSIEGDDEARALGGVHRCRIAEGSVLLAAVFLVSLRSARVGTAMRAPRYGAPRGGPAAGDRAAPTASARARLVPPPPASPRTSGARRRRARPVRRSSIRTGPIRTRTSRSIGAPTAPNIRRSWRFQPWARIADTRRAAPGGGSRSATSRRGLELGRRSEAGERRQPFLERDAAFQLADLLGGQRARGDRSRTPVRRRGADAGRARPSRRRWSG